ncbi:MAG: DUF4864 domain-containing protein [Albidovulum sp.]|uniref:DUF4864 domain-containing protein n=1 Tax=Albidovulum sp. TaxID=1872424 RepID=UPI003CACFC21
MRRIVLGLGLMFLVGASASADDGSDIRSVIGDQIAAFAADDLPKAFDFASPMIQRMFNDPETFGRMVATGYPMIWRPDAVRYLDLHEEDGRMLQRMGFRDGAGQFHLFDYDMIAGPDGWLINGVYPVPPEDVGV